MLRYMLLSHDSFVLPIGTRISAVLWYRFVARGLVLVKKGVKDLPQGVRGAVGAYFVERLRLSSSHSVGALSPLYVA